MERILAILGKGLQITRADLEVVEQELMNMPAEQRYERQGDIYEGLELIVMDPDYLGDITMDDLGELGLTA